MAVYLADKSALTRSDTRPEVRDVAEPLILAGRIATCGIVDVGASLRSVARSADRRLRRGGGLSVLRYDDDYERISSVTGQPVQWVVPPGTVP